MTVSFTSPPLPPHPPLPADPVLARWFAFLATRLDTISLQLESVQRQQVALAIPGELLTSECLACSLCAGTGCESASCRGH